MGRFGPARVVVAIRRERRRYLTGICRTIYAVRLVRRFTSILLLVALVALGTGVLARLHAEQHARADAICARDHTDRPAAPGHRPGDHPARSESDCLVHALLATPFTLAEPGIGWNAPLASSGTVESRQTHCLSVRAPLRIDCRGPPVVG
jgi:hypothetical protein